MSEKGNEPRAKQILKDISKKFEELFQEFEVATENVDEDLNEMVKDLSERIKTMEEKIKKVRMENDEVFVDFQSKMSDLSKTIGEAFENAFSNRKRN
jgi:FKBP-type peptidyl-prolyl cis-trans isomerase (trigger factor)